MYEGFYKEDKKHGYGIYTWSDLKKYAGWWCNGKQHGIGVFISKDGKKKYGIWEDGVKLRWFNAEEVKTIEEGNFDFKAVYKRSDESLSKMNEFKVIFHPDSEFYTARSDLIHKISELNINVEIDSLHPN